MQREADRSWMRSSWTGPALALAALSVYVWTMARGAFPGASAAMLVWHADIDPMYFKTAPVWGFIIRLLDRVPWVPLPYLANAFSAVCGALSVWLMYELVSRIPHDRTAEENHAHFNAAWVQGLSGMTAALFLAFSAPFWMVSNRAHPLSLSILMLLLATFLFLRFWGEGRARHLYPFVILYGIGTVEFTTFIMVGPIFAFALFVAMWRWRWLGFGPVTRVVLCYLAGLLLYVYAAWRFWNSPAADWAGMEHFFGTVWMIWRDQYQEIRRNMSQLGWLWIFMIAVLPWLIVMAPKKGIHERVARIGSYALHVLLAALAILLLYNFRLAPHRLLGPDRMLVTPYVLMASWAGYVAGYWFVVLFRRRREFHAHNTLQKRMQGVRRLLRGVYPAAVGAIMVAVIPVSLPDADGRAEKGVNRLAHELLDRMEGRTWLISDGVLDANVQLIAHERGIRLNILNPRMGRDAYYLRYVASFFEEPRLKNLANIGLLPAINEWFSMHPEIEQDLMILSAPDLWFSHEYYPVPQVMVFRGHRDSGAIDPEQIYAEHVEFWSALWRDAALETDNVYMKPYMRYGRRHLGKVANNLGVMLDELGRGDLAYDAYQWSRRLDDYNVSALLNLISLARREDDLEAAGYEAEFEELSASREFGLNVWNLSHHFGYVRVPEMHVGRGYAWAATGRPHIAAGELERAVALGEEGDRMDLLLAALYVAQKRPEEGEQALLRILERNPHNWQAMLGLAQITMARGDYDSARAYLGRLAGMDAPPIEIDVETALLDALTGHVDEARARLRQVVRTEPEHHRAWATLGMLALEEDDLDEFENAVNRLTRMGSVEPRIHYVLAQMYAASDRHDAAEAQLENLLKQQPDHIPALEWLLRYDRMHARKDRARERAEKLLRLDSGNFLANYIIGMIQYDAGHYLLAESSFRASLRRERNFAVLTDLAWLLQRRGLYEEALLLAREAVEMEPQQSSAWHTLGLVLLRMDRLEEAAEALDQALSLQPGNVYAKYYTALIYEKEGMIHEAIDLLDDVLLRGDPMLPEVQEDARTSLIRMRRAVTGSVRHNTGG